MKLVDVIINEDDCRLSKNEEYGWILTLAIFCFLALC